MDVLVAALLLFTQAGAGPIASPTLILEAPPEFAAIGRRLESMESRRLEDITRLVGLQDAGSAIRVVLAAENSEWARRVSPWIAGFATGGSASVVLFPERTPDYPHDTLADVLRHEVAHVLIWRASAGRSIPRWFNEGLAMEAERERRLRDQTQLLYQLVKGSRPNLVDLERLFSGGRSDQTRAYALAGALVHDLFRQYGAGVCAAILERMRQGVDFDAAFRDVTGKSSVEADADFWGRHRIWTTWVPIVTSSAMVWLMIALLALLAIYMRRRRNRQIEERWAEEDGDD